MFQVNVQTGNLITHQPLPHMKMPADFNFQLQNLIFLITPVLKALYDVFFKEKLGLPVNHRQSLSYTMMFGFLLVLIDFRTSPVIYLWQPMLLATGYFFLVFDYLRNVLAEKQWYYIDDGTREDPEEDSWVDRHLYSKLGPLGTLFLKVWIFITAHACYYYFSYI